MKNGHAGGPTRLPLHPSFVVLNRFQSLWVPRGGERAQRHSSRQHWKAVNFPARFVVSGTFSSLDGNSTGPYDKPTNAKESIMLRPATPNDVKILTHWYTKPHIQAQAVGESAPYDFEVELVRTVPWREMLMADYDGISIGFVRLSPSTAEHT